MHIVVLGSGPNQTGLIEAARGRASTLSVISPELSPRLKQIVDIHVCCNLRDELDATQLFLSHRPDAVVSTGSDIAVRLQSEICNRFDLPGPTPEAALLSNKFHMKTMFLQAALRTPRWRKASSLDEVRASSREFADSVIIKIPDGSGSRGTYIAHNVDDAVRGAGDAMSQTTAGAIIVEELVEGLEFGAQAVVSNGNLVGVVLHDDTVLGTVTTVPVGHALPFSGNAQFGKSIEEMMLALCRAVDLGSCIVNLDLMAAGNDVYLLEASARMGATALPEVIELATGWNAYSAIIDLSAGIEVRPIPSVVRSVAAQLIRAQADGVIAANSEAVVESYRKCAGAKVLSVQVDGVPGDRVRRFCTGQDRIGHVVSTGGCASSAVTRAEEVARSVAGRIVIEQGTQECIT